MHRIALVNQKGGVGKSTTAVNLSAGLARLGKRVLLIDLDPQAHATVAVGLDPRKLDATVYTLLSGATTLKDVIRPVSERLSVIPTNIHLAGGEAELASLPNPASVLKRAMADLDETQYDYAIIDSPPQLGFLNVNSLAWVREVFIPVTCEFYALHGLSLLMETVERIKGRLNPLLRISGVITCQVHPRRAVTRDVLSELERHFPGRVLKTRIRVNVRLVEAPSHGKPIFEYAPDSNGAADYHALAQELIALNPENAPVQEPAAESIVESQPQPEPVAEMQAPEPVAESPDVPVEPTPAVEPVAETPPVAEGPYVPVEAASVAEPVAEGPYVPAEPTPAVEPVAETPPVAEGPYVPVEAAPELVAESPYVPAASEAAPVAELPDAVIAPDPEPEPEPQPVAETPYVAMEPGAPLTTPVAAPEPAVETPYVALEPGVPLTTPVGKSEAEPPSGAPGSSSTYAQMLGLAGLKPIVVAKPGGATYPAPEKPKQAFGRRLLGKLMGRKD